MELGYNTRGLLIDKLKGLLADTQSKYETFLDAQTLYEQGKIDDKEFFTRMGDFVKIFASLGFLTAKVVIELDKAIGKEKEEVGGVKPSPSYQDLMTSKTRERRCVHCGSAIPAAAKFCTKCGKKQS